MLNGHAADRCSATDQGSMPLNAGGHGIEAGSRYEEMWVVGSVVHLQKQSLRHNRRFINCKRLQLNVNVRRDNHSPRS